MLPVDQWDAILVYWVLKKLDAESRKQFEIVHPGTDVLTFSEQTSFIDRRSRALESSGTQQPEAFTPKTPKKERQAVVKKLKLCLNCLGRHFVADCPSNFQLQNLQREASHILAL